MKEDNRTNEQPLEETNKPQTEVVVIKKIQRKTGNE